MRCWTGASRRCRFDSYRRPDPSHLEQRTRQSAGQTTAASKLDLLPPGVCAHHFFAAISFITSIARSRSASSFFSLPFSDSSAFSFLASSASVAPKRLRHEYSVCSLTEYFFAASATEVRSDSRRILTICSSVNRLLRMLSPGGAGEAFSHVSRGPIFGQQITRLEGCFRHERHLTRLAAHLRFAADAARVRPGAAETWYVGCTIDGP